VTSLPRGIAAATVCALLIASPWPVPAARAFYTSLGYEEIGLLRDLLLPGKGEVLMRKTIAAWRPFRRGDAPA
jgi:hypothetical protein